jgi:hypothetical protein
MTLLSCHRFPSNEVRLWLSLIAYNLWRRLVLPERIDNWFLTSLQQDRRRPDQARAVLLALAGGRASDTAGVRGNMRRMAALPLSNGWQTKRRGESSTQKSSRGKSQGRGSLEAGNRSERSQRDGQDAPRCRTG